MRINTDFRDRIVDFTDGIAEGPDLIPDDADRFANSSLRSSDIKKASF